MKKFLLLSLLILILQNYISQTDNKGNIYNKDVSSIDHIIAAMYDVISGPAGQRDWDRFHNLYHKNAYMMAIFATSDSTHSSRTFSPAEYVERCDDMMKKDAFKEIELSRKMERFGNLVQVFSAYEFTTPTIVKTGINSLQLFFDGERWWIMTVIWQESNPNLALPKWVK
jgi:hypothetical protein